MSYEHRPTRPKFEYNGRTLEIRSAKYTPEIIRRVLDAYVDGARPSVLSREHGVPASTIEKWCDNAGVIRSRREAAVVRVIDDDGVSPVWFARKSVEMYEAGKSLSQVAKLLSISHSTVYKHLREAGVKTRSQTEGQLIRIHGSMDAYIASVQRICHMYHRQGMARGEIVRKTGHCHRTVEKALVSKYNPWRKGSQNEAAEDVVRRMFTADDRARTFTDRDYGIRARPYPAWRGV